MSRPPLTVTPERCATAAAAATAGLALLALLGWALDVVPLRAVIPGLAPMDPATAAGLLAASLALLLLRDEAGPGPRRLAGVGAGMAVAALGLLFAAAVLGWDRGLARQVFGGVGDAMPPNTAACLLFLGLALALTDVGPPRRPWPLLRGP